MITALTLFAGMFIGAFIATLVLSAVMINSLKRRK
jgi:hypothetical protein|nr:MAG TPA: Protein of unknown function (DUF3789) [Caudoviricetes sp.]